MIHPDTLQVHVDLDGATLFAGRAYFHRSRGALASSTFQYEAAYLADPRAYAIDPALPLVSGSQQVRPGLPGAFSDSAPDRWGRNLIAKRERAAAREDARIPRQLDDVDFLAGVSDETRQGALRFRTDDDPAFLAAGRGVPKFIHLPELLNAADAVARERDDDDLAAVKTLLSAGSGSLGGARPKASVLADDDRPLIAKFPHRDDEWDVMAWEATALDLAYAAGIRTPPHRLVSLDNRHVLLVRRFDRTSRGHRVGYLSAMTLLEHRDGESADYVDIVEQFDEVSARATEDARELFRRVAVSVGINNTDDHLRNHGFLRAQGGWVLSPVFDINPNPQAAARQTTIAGAENPDDAAEGLRQLAHYCRLSNEDARTELTHIAETLDTWQDVALRNSVPKAALARFAATFRTGRATLHEAARR